MYFRAPSTAMGYSAACTCGSSSKSEKITITIAIASLFQQDGQLDELIILLQYKFLMSNMQQIGTYMHACMYYIATLWKESLCAVYIYIAYLELAVEYQIFHT